MMNPLRGADTGSLNFKRGIGSHASANASARAPRCMHACERIRANASARTALCSMLGAEGAHDNMHDA